MPKLVSFTKQTRAPQESTGFHRRHSHLQCHDRRWCYSLRLRHKIYSDSLQGASPCVLPD